MASAGISRSKTFELAATSTSPTAAYFEAINTLVNEFRYDYPEACRMIGIQAKSENMQSFLLRFSDALRAGEQLAEFLAREAAVQGEDYQNDYERSLEGMKQWTNAFSSIVISVALILIIQIISSMIYSVNNQVMGMSVFAGVTLAGFGAYIIWRSAPREAIALPSTSGAIEQQKVARVFRLAVPLALGTASVIYALTGSIGWALIWVSLCVLPVGIMSLLVDRRLVRKDKEYATFLRSSGGMATASGTTIKQALTKLDLGSFPMLEPDITRLSARLSALIEPEVCWHKFGLESGSKLISEVTDIFYSAIKIGGDPERVGYLCSLFAFKTTQLRAKRRLISSTFSGLTSVMHAVVAILMVFVYSIVHNFAIALAAMSKPSAQALASSSANSALSLSMAQYSASDLQFLLLMTTAMVLLLAVISSVATTMSDGGFKLKVFLYLSITMAISGVAFLVVPSVVSGILKIK